MISSYNPRFARKFLQVVHANPQNTLWQTGGISANHHKTKLQRTNSTLVKDIFGGYICVMLSCEKTFLLIRVITSILACLLLVLHNHERYSFMLRFESVVTIGTFILMSIYSLILLPLFGIKKTVSGYFFFVLGTICSYVLAVLFGAPTGLFSQDYIIGIRNLIWSSLFSCIIVMSNLFFIDFEIYRVIYPRGRFAEQIVTVVSQAKYNATNFEQRFQDNPYPQKEDHLSQSLSRWHFWTVVGFTWASAFVIPLDWDRPYQPFPISTLFGTLLGEVIGTAFVTVQHLAKYFSSRKVKHD